MPKPTSRISVGAPLALTGTFAMALLFLLPSAPASAQVPNPVQEAGQLLASGDASGAVALLLPYLEKSPEAAGGWLILARAHAAMGAWEESLAAAEKAGAFPQTAPQARLEVALAYAGKGDLDRALQVLEEVKKEGRVDLTAVAVQDRAAGVVDDPRFADLLPTRAEYEDPFVEDVRVLQEWRGEAPGGSFGWIARNIGDVDGDGLPDVTTSAPDLNQNTGRIYVFSTGSGELLWTADGESSGEQFGTGLEAAGDVDGDDIPDVVAGGPGAGRAVVYSGRTGAVIHTFRGDAEQAFGQGVSDVGDVNGDGYADVAISAPGPRQGGGGPGSAWVYSGEDGSVLLELHGDSPGDQFGSALAGSVDEEGTSLLVVGAGGAGQGGAGQTFVYRDLNPDPLFIIEADETGTWLGGMFVSVPGDVNGDGVMDVYSSDWSNGALGPQTGRIYVRSGLDGSSLLTLTGEAQGEGFGTSPSDAGDLNGDGYADLAVGAWQHASHAPGGGKISVFSGRSGNLVWAVTGRVMGETLGFDSTGMGDVDGDGIGDLLVTSAWSFVNGPRSGRVYVLAGKKW